LTSRYPTVNQAAKQGGLIGGKLPKWRIICPEIFREAGYRTSGIADGMFLTNRYGLEQGYDDFVGWGRRARNIVPRAIRWLEKNGGQPFFLFVHIFDIHLPYALTSRHQEMFLDFEYEGGLLPGISLQAQVKKRRLESEDGGTGMSAEDGRYLQTLYEGGIRYTDEILEELFTYLRQSGLLGSTAVVIFSDHGEEFLEHDVLQHAVLYRTVTHVPLLFRLPGGELGGTRIPNTVGLIDVVPTLLDLTGLSSPVPMSGESMLPLMRGETDRFRRFTFSENMDEGGMVSLIDDEHHLLGKLNKDRWSLYRHTDDRLEQRDLIKEKPALADSLRAVLSAFRASLLNEIDEEAGREKEELDLDERTIEALKAFGYLQ
jgi:arylsulfatase A-like enzyme